MKTIIAGTDFSRSSLNACRYAALVASRLKCRLILFNLFEVPLLHANIGVYGSTYNDMQKKGQNKMTRLLGELNTLFPKLQVSAFVSNNPLKEELQLFTEKYQVEAVVMGLESKTKISRYIYGSHGTEVAGKINAPVIIVPDNYKNHKFDHLLLAMDNTEKLHKASVKPLEKMLAAAKANIRALHVRTDAEVFKPTAYKLVLNGKTIPVETRRAKNLSNGLKNDSKENPVDMIVMISRRHSAFYNFFFETNTKKIIFAARVPVMAIHE